MSRTSRVFIFGLAFALAAAGCKKKSPPPPPPPPPPAAPAPAPKAAAPTPAASTTTVKGASVSTSTVKGAPAAPPAKGATAGIPAPAAKTAPPAAPAPAAKAAAPAAPTAQASTATAKGAAAAKPEETKTKAVLPDNYYTAGKLRDPFVPLDGSGGGGGAPAAAAAVQASTDTFNIHSLNLKGILDTPNGPIALLSDPSTGSSYVLKGGKVLGGAKNQPIAGISGQVRGRGVRLMTKENDVQDLRLGESE